MAAQLRRHGAAAEVQVLANVRPSRMSPADAARHVGALHRLAGLLAQTMEAQIMEACWRIFTGASSEAEALRLVAEHTPLPAERARRYADCWEAARGNRQVMDLAVDRPLEALRLVSEVAEAAGQDAALDDVGREVARIVALPKGRRVEALRGLVAARDAAAAGRDPADVARIAELEDANAALQEADPGPIARWKALHERLEGAVREAEAAADDLDRLRPATPRHRDRLLRRCDDLTAAADRIAARLAGEEAA